LSIEESRVNQLDFKEEILKTKYLDVPLSIQIRNDMVMEIKIGNSTWAITKDRITKNDYVLATKKFDIVEPYDKALEAMYTELNVVLLELQKLVAGIVPTLK
jgi:hypothetical protein